MFAQDLRSCLCVQAEARLAEPTLVVRVGPEPAVAAAAGRLYSAVARARAARTRCRFVLTTWLVRVGVRGLIRVNGPAGSASAGSASSFASLVSTPSSSALARYVLRAACTIRSHRYVCVA